MKDQPNEIKHKKNSLKLEEPDIDLKQYSLSTTNLAFVNKSGYNITSISLPKNFFENLLILEMDLEEEFSTEKLIQLVQQYSNAIEYYTEENPIKAKAYQNRMEYLLTNKDTLMKLKRQNENMNTGTGRNRDEGAVNRRHRPDQHGNHEETGEGWLGGIPAEPGKPLGGAAGRRAFHCGGHQ